MQWLYRNNTAVSYVHRDSLSLSLLLESVTSPSVLASLQPNGRCIYKPQPTGIQNAAASRQPTAETFSAAKPTSFALESFLPSNRFFTPRSNRNTLAANNRLFGVTMDPVTAIGFASSILTFIDVGVKVVKTTNEIRNSVDGSTKLNATRRTVSKELEGISKRLEPPDGIILSREQDSLRKVAQECQGLSKGMLDLLERVKPSKSSRIPGSALRGAIKAIWKQDDLEGFESQLSDCRGRLTLSLVELFR